jgi:hypothetical protein
MYFIKMFLLTGLGLAFGWRLDDLFRSYANGHDDPKVAKFHSNSGPLRHRGNFTMKDSDKAEECYEKHQS